jgi:hypothetical protein
MGSVTKWGLVVFLAIVVAGGIASAKSGPDGGLKRCTKTSVLTDSNSGTGDYFENLSTEPTIVCSTDFRASAANGWALLFSAPQTTINGVSSTAVQVVAEPAEATSGNGHTSFYGDHGRLTIYGLSALVKDGTLIVHWDD